MANVTETSLGQAAVEAASALSAVLSDPAAVWTRASTGNGRAWPQSLAGGAAGIALLHIIRARTGHGDWRTAHAWLSAASRDPLTAADNAGLYLGVPALAFITYAASSDSGHYARTLTHLDDATVSITRRRLAAARTRLDRGLWPELKEFDLIRGLAGLGAYHLQRHPDHPIVDDVLTYLIRLTRPLPADPARPPWWTGLAPSGEPHPDFPHGHVNLGLAHGIGAVMALLALAILHERPHPGLPEALSRICTWTDRWRHDDDDNPWWPGFIAPDQADRPRPSWCYGVAGTARAQQLAGMALGDATRQRAAEAAMLAALNDPKHLDLLGPQIGLCHGTAGLLQAAWRMANDALTPDLAFPLPLVAGRLISQLDGPLDPELLDGAAGAALVLYTIGVGSLPGPAWDRFLLLA